MVESKQFSRFSVEAFTQGKTAKDKSKPQKNEDRWVATPHYLAVIDGATANPPIIIDGLTSGEYASATIADIVKKTPPGLSGQELIDTITDQFQKSLQQLPKETTQALRENPHAKPYASLAIAMLGTEEIKITQLGDVSFRINGRRIYSNPKEIDDIHAKQRITAIKNAQKIHPRLKLPELLEIGKNAILHSLRRQVQDLQNNSSHPLGYGVIDGSPVNGKYAQNYTLIAKGVQTLELFSDGYFKPGEKPKIKSWEKAFREVEKEDPYKIGKYPSVKGSTKEMHTDDRTILIAKFKK